MKIIRNVITCTVDVSACSKNYPERSRGPAVGAGEGPLPGVGAGVALQRRLGGEGGGALEAGERGAAAVARLMGVARTLWGGWRVMVVEGDGGGG